MSQETLERLLVDKTGELESDTKYTYVLDSDGATVGNTKAPLAGTVKLYWTDPIELWNWATTTLEVNNPHSVALVEPLRLLLLDGKWRVDSAGLGDGHTSDEEQRVSFFISVEGSGPLYRFRSELDVFVVFDWTISGDYFHAGTPEGVLERLNWLHAMNAAYPIGENDD